MIVENDPFGKNETGNTDLLAGVASGFDYCTTSLGPAAWMSIVVPRAEFLTIYPDYPTEAQPSSGRVANGCGLDPDRCRASGLGEAVELASCCAWGDLALVRATARDMPDGTIGPQEVTGFSDAQVRARGAWNLRYGAYDWQPPPYLGAEIDWIAGTNAVTGADVFVPADHVLIGRRTSGDKAAVAIADSNGCAAGATKALAMEAALLELIERDATGRWWYGRRTRATLPAALLDRWPVLAHWLERRTRRTRLLDLTSDLGVPVAASLSTEPDGSLPALGFAARFEMAEAAGAAVAEMLAVEMSLLRSADQIGDLAKEWLARSPAAIPPVGRAKTNARTGALAASGRSLQRAIDALDSKRHRIVLVELTRKAFGVPVVRAIVPGLCHYKPRFGFSRLLASDPHDLALARAFRPNSVPLLI